MIKRDIKTWKKSNLTAVCNNHLCVHSTSEAKNTEENNDKFEWKNS